MRYVSVSSCLLLFSLLHALNLQAQVEVNVKLAPNQEALEQFLLQQRRQDLRDRRAPRALAARHAFLDDITYVEALHPPRAGRSTARELEGIYTFRFEDDRSLNDRLSQLRRQGSFDWVEENHRLQLHRPPSPHPTPLQTPLASSQDDSIGQQWHHRYIRTFQAWERSRGRSEVRIGILDTGIDYHHPEFEGQLAINSLEDLNGNGTFEPWPSDEIRNGFPGDFDGEDNDGNGYADDVIGYDFTDQPRSPFGGDYLFEDPDPRDDNDHGTLVAGIAAAKADNGWGGAGVAPGCKLVTLRAFSASGAGEDDDVARAIVYAADNGIRILNFSFGDIYYSQMMHAAIRYAYRKGVVMVSSAGNGTGDELHYPSGYDEVISVSATAADQANDQEFLWPLSSYGLTVDLAAPGSGIFTTVIQDTLDNGSVRRFSRPSGTSTAAPMVAGAVGLLFSLRPGLSPQQVRGMLTSSTDDISEAGWDHFTGAGRLNIERLLAVVGASNVQILSPANDGGSAQDTVYVRGTVLDPEFRSFQLEYQLGVEGAETWIPMTDPQTYQRYNDTLASWVLTDLPEGEYTLRLRLEKTNGSTAEDRIRFIRDTSPPETRVLRMVQVWDNQLRKLLWVFRSSDQAQHVLHLRPQGGRSFQQHPYDRLTRNGEFLLGPDKLAPGTYEYFIQSTNYAGLSSQTPLQSFVYDGGSLNTSGFEQLSYALPMGRMLNQTFDFDQDGLQEVAMTRYDERLSLERLVFLEYQGGRFVVEDSLGFKPTLILKDVVDSDGDGLQEVLCSVNDSTYLVEQPELGQYPEAVVYQNEDEGLFAAQFGDTDGDQELELLMKDFEDYYVFERNGEQFERAATLSNTSPNNSGSNAPRALVGDFDQDGRPETVYQDFDGDLLVYEYQANGQYLNTWTDTTELVREESTSYLLQGDFDGDGQQEFLVALHTSNKRNEDFEYTPLYWWFRIFKASGDDAYEVVWEDYLYDVDNRTYNASTAGNLDQDLAEEIVFTAFPRTYVLDHNGSGYEFIWYYYGSLATHHIIADFNENGVAELGLGLGDSTVFFEQTIAFNGPKPVTSLSGKVLGTDRTQLDWQAVPTATEYLIYRGPLQPNDNTVRFSLIDSTMQTRYVDEAASFGARYLYVLRTKNPGLSPELGVFDLLETNFVLLRPHPNVRIDSVQVVGPDQLEVYFDQAVIDRPSDQSLFVLNETHRPTSIVGAPQRDRLLLTFPQPFEPGPQQLVVDPAFLDAERGVIDPGSRIQSFQYEELAEDQLILTQWEAINDKEVILRFNYPLNEQALDSARYRVSPVGTVKGVAWASEHEDAVQLTLEDARIGALGYAVSITVGEVCSVNALCMGEEGNTATFSSHRDDLSEVFAYPNPVRKHDQFNGMRFANLTREATIRIYTLSGRLINEIEETDGDGGTEWNLLDKDGQRIKPGIYLYHVSSELEGVEEVLGKFSVVE